jgi:hypothetical protein
MARALRQIAVRVLKLVDQRRNTRCSLIDHPAIFRQVPSQSVDALRALAHQHVRRCEDDVTRLLCLVLYRNETHARPLSRLAARLGNGGVVLLPLHERLDVRRRYQLDRMTKLHDLAYPVMRAAAGFQSKHRG